eukprot:scaffold2647_cov75-Cylindrotheca_fusiformis.AAC.3
MDASMEEENRKRKHSEDNSEEVASKWFVYTSETKNADIPKETLTHLRVDSAVREIPDEVFEFCEALVHVQLPETLTRIGMIAFDHCHSLKCVQFVSDYESVVETSSITPNLEDGTIVFPEGGKLQIENFAFRACTSLRKVIVCSVSTRLGEGAFCTCEGLLSVELPEGLRVIEEWTFCACRSLNTVKFPSSMIKIRDHAFNGCRSLTSVELPHGLLEIGCSFEACDSILTLHIPSTVSSIGDRAFRSCSGLRQIKLPPTLERIEFRMFEECRKLQYIEIPSTVSFIDSLAFSCCSCLSHIRIPPCVKTIDGNAFGHCRSLISIELPEGVLFDIAANRFTNSPLVNVAGGRIELPRFQRDREAFFRDSKLGRISNDEAILNRKLKHRFDNSPLNKLCYYQSYHSSEDAMLQLRSLMEDCPLAATFQVDEFGMTPLHVLCLSQTPNVDMLVALMKAGHSDHIIHGRDSFGSTPMDYLCLNRMPNSTKVIRIVLQTRFDYLLNLHLSWKSDMLQAVDEALAVDISSRKSDIVAIYLKLATYERKEVLSLLELRLWKIKVDEIVSKEEQEIASSSSRESCRVNSGATIVIPHVLPFLGKPDVKDYY